MPTPSINFCDYSVPDPQVGESIGRGFGSDTAAAFRATRSFSAGPNIWASDAGPDGTFFCSSFEPLWATKRVFVGSWVTAVLKARVDGNVWRADCYAFCDFSSPLGEFEVLPLLAANDYAPKQVVMGLIWSPDAKPVDTEPTETPQG